MKSAAILLLGSSALGRPLHGQRRSCQRKTFTAVLELSRQSELVCNPGATGSLAKKQPHGISYAPGLANLKHDVTPYANMRDWGARRTLAHLPKLSECSSFCRDVYIAQTLLP